jgi:hypothetical protein
MLQQNETGAVNGAVFSLVIAILLLVGAVAFGGWAFSSRQDYKNNTDAKIATAVTVAKQQEGTLKDAQFAQAEKDPLATYNGPEAYGSIVVRYPKTWSGYAAISNNGSGSSGNAAVDDYFYPGIVPSTTDQSSVFALRIQVLNQSFASVVKQITQSQSAANPPTVSPYVLPKVPSAVGVEINGTLPVTNGTGNKTGIMVILPLRSETIEIWTEGSQFTGDFNNSVLPNFSFSP